MAFLPKTHLTLTGGCYCKANRYTITIPPWSDRPKVPGALDTPISSTEKEETRVPLVALDHCSMCRRVSGAIVQCWLIVPAEWVVWDLLVTEEGEEESRRVTGVSTLEAASISSTTTTTVAAKQALLPTTTTFLTRFKATERATRMFCTRCGTNLSYVSHKRQTHEAVVDITVGSLDQESLELVRPDRHGWWEFGIGWVRDLLTKGDGGFLNRHPAGEISKRA